MPMLPSEVVHLVLPMSFMPTEDEGLVLGIEIPGFVTCSHFLGKICLFSFLIHNVGAILMIQST